MTAIRDLAIICTIGAVYSAALVVAIWRHNTREGERQERARREYAQRLRIERTITLAELAVWDYERTLDDQQI